MSCNKKKCGCQELVDKEVAQKMIRTHYVEHFKDSALKDAAKLLLLLYITIKSHRGIKQNSFTYNVPFFTIKEEEKVPLFCVIITSALCLALLSINRKICRKESQT